MQGKRVLCLGVIAMLASLTGCYVPPQEVEFTELDNGRTVSLTAGTNFKIKLVSNASTGYSWSLTALDTAVLMYTGHQYIAPGSAQVGAAGSEEWEFHTLASGTATLRMQYRQSGELLPAATFEITIVVVPSGVQEYTEADSGRTVTLAAGTHFKVKLASNATTGYQWDLTTLSSAVLSYVQDRYIPPTSSAIGAGGSEEWEFMTRATGTGTLQLDYLRASDWTSTPGQTFRLTVIVAP